MVPTSTSKRIRLALCFLLLVASSVAVEVFEPTPIEAFGDDATQTCDVDDDCPKSSFCRQSDPASPYAPKGVCHDYSQADEMCGGYTPAWFENRCADGLVCEGRGLAVDLPGVCRASCQRQSDCTDGHYCSETAEDPYGREVDNGLCRRHGQCYRDSDCTDRHNQWFHVMCVGHAECGINGKCKWRCTSTPGIDLPEDIPEDLAIRLSTSTLSTEFLAPSGVPFDIHADNDLDVTVTTCLPHVSLSHSHGSAVESSGCTSSSVTMNAGDSVAFSATSDKTNQISLAIEAAPRRRSKSLPKDLNVGSRVVGGLLRANGDKLLRDFDLMAEDNAKDHRTTMYRFRDEDGDAAGRKLVVRHGQSFQVEVVASQEIDVAKHKLSLVFDFEKSEAMSVDVKPKGSKLSDTDPDARILDVVSRVSDMKGHLIEVFLPASTPVALYTAAVRVGKESFKADIPVAVIFNPFASEDDVYLDNEDMRQEYLFNEDGAIWVGSEYQNVPRDWYFGQFEPEALALALEILEELPLEQRTAQRVSRKISEMATYVILGRWRTPYYPYTEPSEWTGSSDILREYYDRSPRSPVRWAQCWVFGGLVNTFGRALGIPSRPLTVFQSAHDADRPYNRAIDNYYDHTGRPVQMSRDSIWNFHVWNDFWLRRPDLSKDGEFDGWQAVDGTPQEESPFDSGIYQMGPASVNAVKQHLPPVEEGVDQDDERWDNSFVISEVDAVINHWVQKDSSCPLNRRSCYKLAQQEKGKTGKSISTKAMLQDDREDITANYKSLDYVNMVTLPTVAENGCSFTAGLTSRKGLDYDDAIEAGDDVSFTTVADCEEDRPGLTHRIEVVLLLGDGRPVRDPVSDLPLPALLDVTFTGAKAGRHEFTSVLEEDEYVHLLGLGHDIKVSIFVSDEKKPVFVRDDQVTLMMPSVQLDAPTAMSTTETRYATIRFENPLDIPLHRVTLSVSSKLLPDGRVRYIVPAIEARGSLEKTIRLKASGVPSSEGEVSIRATLTSDEMTDVFGDANVAINHS